MTKFPARRGVAIAERNSTIHAYTFSFGTDIMQACPEWRSALEQAAREMLRQAGQTSPPVDALAVARALQLTVALDRSQRGRGRIKRIAGQSTIFLRPDERPERLQWAAAHELGESQIRTICQSIGASGDDLAPRQREELANQFAKELLLPIDWFQRDSRQTDYDLLALKTHYRTVSHELIAARWLDLDSPGIVTVFDQGAATSRRSNGPTRPPLAAIERACWDQLRRTRRPAQTQAAPLTVRGWCIDSPGWQREILYAVWTEEEL